MSNPGQPYMAALSGLLILSGGQLYNRDYFKAVFWFGLELLINNCGHINQSIYWSFLGDIPQAQHVLNYQWAMYYPSAYLLSMMEAYITTYHRAHLSHPPAVNVLPFVLGAMLGCVGVIYGGRFMPGPIFVGLGGMMLGALIGWIIKLVSTQKKPCQ